MTKIGGRALLMSETFLAPAEKEKCLSFWYHSSGLSTGSLRVKIADENSTSIRTLWELIGAQSDNTVDWRPGVLPLNNLVYPYDPYKIMIEGTVGFVDPDGDTVYGHIA